jgi:lipoyl-dependent peroxiredoxin
MAIEKLYTASAKATGGRQGRTTSSDGTIDFPLAMPKALGGNEKEGHTNPEQLFAAGYAACFGGALGLVARQAGVDASNSHIEAHVHIGKDSADGGFGLAVELHAYLPGIDQAQAEALVAKAHEVCPYSKATRGNIEVTVQAHV